jgi:hypothetical protein
VLSHEHREGKQGKGLLCASSKSQREPKNGQRNQFPATGTEALSAWHSGDNAARQWGAILLFSGLNVNVFLLPVSSVHDVSEGSQQQVY